MLGSYGGKARLQTDVQGIGVATRMEVGRLSLTIISRLPSPTVAHCVRNSWDLP